MTGTIGLSACLSWRISSYPSAFWLEPSSFELHTFSDACVSGCSACAYLLSVCDDGTVFCKLLVGKSRVAPVKPVTIARLDLQQSLL